jgi:hypothetical protein
VGCPASAVFREMSIRVNSSPTRVNSSQFEYNSSQLRSTRVQFESTREISIFTRARCGPGSSSGLAKARLEPVSSSARVWLEIGLSFARVELTRVKWS